jgi:hypothetical protein
MIIPLTLENQSLHKGFGPIGMQFIRIDSQL